MSKVKDLYVRHADGTLEKTKALEGLSAYDSAVIGGYTGTETEFYQKLSDVATNEYVDTEIDELNQTIVDNTSRIKALEDASVEIVDYTIDTAHRFDTTTGEWVPAGKYCAVPKMSVGDGIKISFDASDYGIRLFKWASDGTLTVKDWTTHFDEKISDCEYVGINLSNYNGTSYGYAKISETDVENLYDILKIYTSKTNGKKAFRILGIGNSYTRDSMRWLWAILNDCGYEPIIGHGYIGGVTLEEQYKSIIDETDANHSAYQYWKYTTYNAAIKTSQTLESIIKDEEWDYVIFQQQSDEAGQYTSYVNDNFDINDFVAKVKEFIGNDKLKIGFNATWSHPDSYSGEKFIEYYGRSGEAQDEAIQTVVPTVANHIEDIDFIINTGNAVKMARTNSLLGAMGDKMTRDKNHLAYGIPQYMLSMCYANALLGVGVDDVVFYPTTELDSGIVEPTNKYLAFLARQYAVRGNIEVN